MANRWGNNGNSDRLYFLGLQNHYGQQTNLKMLAPWKKICDKPRQHVKKQRHHLADKGPYSQSYGFSSSHVCMWVLDHKEGWAPKIWCFQIGVLEKSFEGPLDRKEIKPVNPKWNQSSIFIGKTDAEVDAPILWPPDMKSQLIEKTLMLGKTEGRRKRGLLRMSWLDGITNSVVMGLRKLADSEGQGSLACCSPWSSKDSDMIELLKNNKWEGKR